MAQIQILAPTTDEVTVLFPSAAYRHCVLSADALASAEGVGVNMIAGNAVVAYIDAITGSSPNLSDSSPSANLPGGPTYSFTKDATVSACGVYVDVI
jgi:hypothetical protein